VNARYRCRAVVEKLRLPLQSLREARFTAVTPASLSKPNKVRYGPPTHFRNYGEARETLSAYCQQYAKHISSSLALYWAGEFGFGASARGANQPADYPHLLNQYHGHHQFQLRGGLLQQHSHGRVRYPDQPGLHSPQRQLLWLGHQYGHLHRQQFLRAGY